MKSLNPKMSQQYHEQIRDMAKRIKLWIKAHKGQAPVIQWNCPKNTAVITDVSTAMKTDIIITNPAAKRMIKEAILSAYPAKLEPTVIMLRTAFNLSCEQHATINRS